VRDAVSNDDDATIVQAVVDLAHALGLRVVAEGVESDAQIALLRALGCDWLQGFRLGRPMPAAEFTQLLAAGPLDLGLRDCESRNDRVETAYCK
jgi:EAL domain-containing protein (putative c-di-GMP-specific phosphodiesterase class I)